MRAKGHREAGQFADGFRNHRGSHLVHLQAAIRLGNIHAHQPQLAGLAQQSFGDIEFLGLNVRSRRQHLVEGELHRGFRDLPLLFGEILRCEYVARVALFEQEAAALRRFCGHGCCYRRHSSYLANFEIGWSVMEPSPCGRGSVQVLENSGGAHSAAHAHGHHAVLRVATL